MNSMRETEVKARMKVENSKRVPVFGQKWQELRTVFGG